MGGYKGKNMVTIQPCGPAAPVSSRQQEPGAAGPQG